MKLKGLIALIFLLIGCAGGGPIAGKYPPTYSSPTPATIVIDRPGKFIVGGNNVGVSVNGEKVYDIANGERLTFKVDPGENRFGAMGRNSWTNRMAHHEIPIDCEPNKTYYLLVQVHHNIAPTIEEAKAPAIN